MMSSGLHRASVDKFSQKFPAPLLLLVPATKGGIRLRQAIVNNAIASIK